MSTPRWSMLLRKHGDNFLLWTDEHSVLKTKCELLAEALKRLLFQKVKTSKDADYVWKAVKPVLSQCNKQSTYDLPFSSVAYTWLYFLERYIRTWLALQVLVQNRCLPLGKYGVQVLDVGTGPGPSAFAIHDFYQTLTKFSEAKGIALLNQPTKIHCVEYAANMNHTRHLLAELAREVTSEPTYDSVLDLCGALPDFEKIKPSQNRSDVFNTMQTAEDHYYNELTGEFECDPKYTTEEANQIAQSLHRYRFFVFSNFLTTVDTIETFKPNLYDLLRDANAGSVMLVLGAHGGQYPDIYSHVDQLASTGGFDRYIESAKVSLSDTALSALVYQKGQQFYNHLQSLSNNRDESIAGIHRHFSEKPNKPKATHVRAYKKNKQK